jgi:hypothetical protein
MSGEPDRFGQVGVSLVEGDEGRLLACDQPLTHFGCRIEAIGDRRDRLGDHIAIVGPAHPHGDIGLVALEADRPHLRRQVDVETRMGCSHLRELRDEVAVSEPGRRVDANEALRRAIRPCATQHVRCAVHVAGDGQSVGSRKGQHEAFGTALDQLLAETVFEGMKAPGDRGVIHAKRAGGSRQASMPPKGQENPQVLPVYVCAFFISH